MEKKNIKKIFVGGIISTINDNFDFMIPDEIKNNTVTVNINVNETVISTIQVPIWDSSTPTSIFIPSGTIVSSIIPPGTIATSSFIVDNVVPVIGLCSEFVSDYNGQFWHRDFDAEWELNQQFILDEIIYYEHFFDSLKNAESNEQKFLVYKNEVYPLLSATWSTFATSGFLNDPILSALQVEYAGSYPGKDKFKNYSNKTFPTIAPVPFVHNLIEETGYLQETCLYLAKPFYENVAYYIALMTKEILNMHTYNKDGYGLPTDGWRQTYIEFKRL
jgi:hypothetical protein